MKSFMIYNHVVYWLPLKACFMQAMLRFLPVAFHSILSKIRLFVCGEVLQLRLCRAGQLPINTVLQ